ncbi:MAG: enoyl-ACP reductase [Gammaproteobacteria bacterium]|nr:enoyl-ACP reductase [Gammaproteobacteria bacterium]
MGFLTGKKALIVGVGNQRSIAYGIAKAMHDQGAELAFTYLNDRFKDRVIDIAKEFNSKIVLPCDVSSDQEINDLFVELKKEWSSFDILIHSVAFAPSDQLTGPYVDCVTREGFQTAHDISSYSLAGLARASQPMLNDNASILALTYIGSVRVTPSYNVMGIAKASLEANVRYLAASMGPKGVRVNAVSAGPIKTLSASGVKGLKKMLDFNEKVAPLRKNVSIEEVGNAAAFLCSDLASGITGDVLYVDSGFHIIGVPDLIKE